MLDVPGLSHQLDGRQGWRIMGSPTELEGNGPLHRVGEKMSICALLTPQTLSM